MTYSKTTTTTLTTTLTTTYQQQQKNKPSTTSSIAPFMLFDGFDTNSDQQHGPSSSQQESPSSVQLSEIARLLKSEHNTQMSATLHNLLHSLSNPTTETVYHHFIENQIPCRLVTALGGGGDCLRTLRWTFVEVDVPQTNTRLVVEPRFRESFAIAHPTPAFQKILNAIPDIYVGSTRRLSALVEVLCEHVRLSFHAQGLPVPPWRQAIAMTSKWFPHPSRCRRDSWAQPIRPPSHSVDSATIYNCSPHSVLEEVSEGATATATTQQQSSNCKKALQYSNSTPLEGCTVRGGARVDHLACKPLMARAQ